MDILRHSEVFDEGRNDDGENWLVRGIAFHNLFKPLNDSLSDDYDNWRHGIESANMKGETRDNGNGVHVACDTDTCGSR